MSDLPLLQLAHKRLHFLQTRQTLIQKNVMNSDVPGYAAQDITMPTESSSPLAMASTSLNHLQPSGVNGFQVQAGGYRFETTPNGNSVNIEEQMMNSGRVQADFQLASMLYTKTHQYLRLAALGRKA
jgi:flagellar basal-body rod protein FlgB